MTSGRLARTMASAVMPSAAVSTSHSFAKCSCRMSRMSYAIQTVLMLTNSRMPYSESSRP